MLTDEEILGLWSEGKTQKPLRPVLGSKKVIAFARHIEHEAYRRAAAVADTTICATHLPTGVAIYGINAGRAIRALGITGGSDAD